MAFQPLHPDDLALRDALQSLPSAPVPADFDIGEFTASVLAAVDAGQLSRADTRARQQARQAIAVGVTVVAMALGALFGLAFAAGGDGGSPPPPPGQTESASPTGPAGDGQGGRVSSPTGSESVFPPSANADGGDGQGGGGGRGGSEFGGSEYPNQPLPPPPTPPAATTTTTTTPTTTTTTTRPPPASTTTPTAVPPGQASH